MTGAEPSGPVSRRGSVLCVGEPLVVLAPETGEPLRGATRLVADEAGAELNVAVTLARLGVPARFAGRVGDDALGQRICDRLVLEGVQTVVEVDPDRPTGCYLKDPQPTGTRMIYHRTGSAAAGMERLAEGTLDNVGHVHLTGVTPALSAEALALVRGMLTGTRPYTVSFDVNHRAALWPSARAAAHVLADLAALVDVVFVGMDEALALWDVATPRDVRALLEGPAEVVVKDGAGPAHCLAAGGAAWAEPALDVTVVEPTGAGDAFAAGYLAARRDGAAIPACLRFGHLLAASVLRTVGDIGTPPSRRVGAQR